MLDRPPASENTINPKWLIPNFYSTQEVGELERVARTLWPDDPEGFANEFYKRVEAGNYAAIELSPLILQQLDNTDAQDISKGDFDKINQHLEACLKQGPKHKRDPDYLYDAVGKACKVTQR